MFIVSCILVYFTSLYIFCSVLSFCCLVNKRVHISADVFGGRKSLVKLVTWQKTCNYIELFGSSTRDRHARSTHISADVQKMTLNASCMMISGGRTKQLDIFCHVTGFTSDFLSHTCGTYAVLSGSPSVARLQWIYNSIYLSTLNNRKSWMVV